MPYIIAKRDGEHCIFKEGADGGPDGDTLGCHESRADAVAQQRALYVAEPELRAVKMADDTTIEGIGIPFGGPFNGSDLDGERFTEDTDFAFNWFAERPLLYQHGLDNGTGLSVVGRVKEWKLTDLGVWVKAQLDASSEYFEAIRELVKRGKLFFSSGAMRHLVEVDAKTGDIRRWPWVEQSLTPTPANPFAELGFAAAAKHFEMAGLKADWPAEVKAEWTARYQNDLPDASFAFVEPGGEKDEDGKTTPRSLRHFPYRDADGEIDEAHVRNALARIPQSTLPQDAKDKALRVVRHAAEQVGIEIAEKSVKAMSGSYESLLEKLNALVNPSHPFAPADCWSYVVATFPDYFIAMRHEAGETTHWRCEYMLGDDGGPVLGAVVQVEEAYEETKPTMASLAEQAQKAMKQVAALVECTKGLYERRVKEGRVISAANRNRLGQCLEAMRAAVDELAGLLDSTEMPAKAVAVTRQRLDILRLYEATIPR